MLSKFPLSPEFFMLYKFFCYTSCLLYKGPLYLSHVLQNLMLKARSRKQNDKKGKCFMISEWRQPSIFTDTRAQMFQQREWAIKNSRVDALSLIATNLLCDQT